MDFEDIKLDGIADYDNHQISPSVTLRLNTVPPVRWVELFEKKISGRRSTGPDGSTINLIEIELGARFGVTVSRTRLQIQGIDLADFRKYGLRKTLQATVTETNEAYRAQCIQDIKFEKRRRQSEIQVQQQRREASRRAWDDDYVSS